MRYRITIILLAMLLLTAACTLERASETGEPPQPTEAAQVATSTAPPTSASQTTATPQPRATSVSSQNNNTDGTCRVREDWVAIYTIQSGDTLNKIARDAGTTVGTLADANCISDVNTITVGQQIRVPRALTGPSVTITPVPTFGLPLSQQPPEQVGRVSVSESISGDAGNLLLLRDSTITVRWEQPPADLSRVTFLVLEAGWTFDHAGPDATTIGEDSDGAGGWSVQWTVPPSLRGELVALGFGPGGRLDYFVRGNYLASASPAETACRIRPIAGKVVAYHEEPSTASPIAGEFDSTNAVPVMGRSLGGWYAISTNADFSGVGGVDALKWVPVDAPVELEGEGC